MPDLRSPLLGATDLNDPKQVQRILRVFEDNLPVGSERKLHVGIMTSYKNLNGIPNRWQNAFLPNEDLSKPFFSEKAYNCLHYADYDGYPDLSKNLGKAISFCGKNLHAVQLDMIWPDPFEVWRALKAPEEKYEVILQVGEKALAQVNEDEYELIRKLDKYRWVIDRVLLDMSGGHDKPLNPDKFLPLLRRIKKSLPDLDLVVAGGLGPITVHLIEHIAKEFPRISIDAQGKLRPSGNAMDPINCDMVEEYIVRALKILK